MYIARERGDERSDKVVTHGCLPFECSRRKLEYDIIRIVGENFVFICAFPGIDILLNKRADVFWTGALGHCHLHTCPLLDAVIASLLGQLYTRLRFPEGGATNMPSHRPDSALVMTVSCWGRAPERRDSKSWRVRIQGR